MRPEIDSCARKWGDVMKPVHVERVAPTDAGIEAQHMRREQVLKGLT